MDIAVLQLDDTQKAFVVGIVAIVVILFIIGRLSTLHKQRLWSADCVYGHHRWVVYTRFGRPAGMRCTQCGKKCPDGRHVAQGVVDASGQRRAYCTVCGKELTPRGKR